MNWIADSTGRLRERPWYDKSELDEMCERIIVDFLVGRHGHSEFPVSTDDLTVLIEQYTSEFDQYADLSSDGANVEGVTDFFPDRLPIVRIAERLHGGQAWQENRLRTTLTHELGHVILHGVLVPRGQIPLFGMAEGAQLCRCTRDSIGGAPESNWIEWQAGYASGASGVYFMLVSHGS